MSVTLDKGGNVSLDKEAPGLTKVLVALGWQERTTSGAEYDLDASAVLLGPDGKVPDDRHFVFYNNLTSPDGSVEHTGDNLVGAAGGDAEVIRVDLPAVPAGVERIVFPVSIHEAQQRRQNFGQVRDAYIRVVDDTSGRELTRFDLAEDAGSETAMIFGELYRHRAEWKFRAVGQGYSSGLRGIALDFGVDVG